MRCSSGLRGCRPPHGHTMCPRCLAGCSPAGVQRESWLCSVSGLQHCLPGRCCPLRRSRPRRLGAQTRGSLSGVPRSANRRCCSGCKSNCQRQGDRCRDDPSLKRWWRGLSVEELRVGPWACWRRVLQAWRGRGRPTDSCEWRGRLCEDVASLLGHSLRLVEGLVIGQGVVCWAESAGPAGVATSSPRGAPRVVCAQQGGGAGCSRPCAVQQLDLPGGDSERVAQGRGPDGGVLAVGRLLPAEARPRAQHDGPSPADRPECSWPSVSWWVQRRSSPRAGRARQFGTH